MTTEWTLQLKGGLYFREMTGIGPRCTDKVKEAARFPTKREALQSDAYSFPITTFEPVKVKKLLKKVRRKGWLGYTMLEFIITLMILGVVAAIKERW